MTLEDCIQLDKLTLAETNTKEYHRHICSTEKGKLSLCFDGISYAFMLEDVDVTTSKLLETIPHILYKVK